jgi:hypothetical protein
MHTNMLKHTAIGIKERDKLIIDFISKHDGCKSEDAFNGVKSSMSRQTFFKRLAILRSNKIIREEYPNKRDKSLHINNSDLIVIVSNELNYFEGTYFELLRKVLLEIKNIPSAPDESRKVYDNQNGKKVDDNLYERVMRREDLLTFVLVFFKEMVDSYTFKLTIKWPVSIPDRRHLERLQSMTLDRISKMYTKLYAMLKKNNVDNYMKSSKYFRVSIDEALSNTMKSEYGEDVVKAFTKDFEAYGLGKDANMTLSCSALSRSRD